MTYGHLQADCLYTGISSGPNARCRVWEAFTFTYYPKHWADQPSGTEAEDEVLCIDADWLLLLPSDGARRWPWYESTVLTPGDCSEYRLYTTKHTRQLHEHQHHSIFTIITVIIISISICTILRKTSEFKDLKKFLHLESTNTRRVFLNKDIAAIPMKSSSASLPFPERPHSSKV